MKVREKNDQTALPSAVVFWDHVNGGIGGIESLIINLTSELSKHVPVKLVSEKHSVVYKSLIDDGVTFDHALPSDDVGAFVCRDDLLVCFGGQRDYLALLRPNPRVVLWRVFSDMCASSFFERLLLTRTFRLLDRLDALLFMDKYCQQIASRQLGLDLSSPVLPIPIKPSDCRYKVTSLDKELSFSYIGRGNELWKVKPIKHLVMGLSRLDDMIFHLHIFTDSNTLFEQELREIRALNIKVSYHYNIRGHELRDHLIQLSDIHYSMGTAMLEGAVLGIPSLVADGSYDDFPVDHPYRWFVDDIEYYAGAFLESGILRKGKSIAEVVAEIKDKKRLSELSLSTYQAVAENFMLDRIASRLLHADSRARVSDLTWYMPSRWLHLCQTP